MVKPYSANSQPQLLLSSGHYVSPAWIEAELMRLPGIQRAFVSGEALPGPIALLVTDKDKCTIWDQLEQFNTQLPDYARLRGWTCFSSKSQALSIDSGEMTPSGHLIRHAILIKRQSLLKRLTAVTFPNQTDQNHRLLRHTNLTQRNKP